MLASPVSTSVRSPGAKKLQTVSFEFQELKVHGPCICMYSREKSQSKKIADSFFQIPRATRSEKSTDPELVLVVFQENVALHQ